MDRWVVALALLVGCGPLNLLPGRTTPLNVENNNWSDVIVYLIPSAVSNPERIGRVGSVTKATLRLPRMGGQWLLGVRLMASQTSWVSPQEDWMLSAECLRLVIENMLIQTRVLPC